MLRIEQVEWLHVRLLVGTVIAAALTRWLEPWSVALGGGVMAANVWLMKGVLRRALKPGGTVRMLAALAMLVGKFALMLGLLGLLFWKVSVDGVSFAVGITLFLAAAVIEAVRADRVLPGEQ